MFNNVIIKAIRIAFKVILSTILRSEILFIVVLISREILHYGRKVNGLCLVFAFSICLGGFNPTQRFKTELSTNSAYAASGSSSSLVMILLGDQ